ncbi:hypothetical protein COLO4_08190 [Corchorus olitorius]|uniref:Endonuclease/exonuclease/phosphatase n=1 Tax=Corchorus olitorius TaxID=93759 RepID=A0A1R3KGU4_9ROSI|nr:hypothetical protein COLO4_08190 [Corchorus olitorius]
MTPSLGQKISLLPSTKLFFELLETQLGITYPTMNMENSPELRRDPTLKLVVGLIIVLSEGYDSNGRSRSELLDRWLHFGQEELPSVPYCKEMVRDRLFLKRLYERGIANKFPPVLALQITEPNSQTIDVVLGATNITIQGANDELVFVRTPPILLGSISAKFHVNRDDNFSTRHNIQLLLPDITHLSLDNFEEIDCQGPCILNPRTRPLPIGILILNARGALNPNFIRRFEESTFQFSPDIVIITETRLSVVDNIPRRGPMIYDSSLMVEPALFFGGVWLLWNSSQFNFQNTRKTKLSFFTEFALLNSQD